MKRFPLFYERYVEVFGGGGWVLFHKAPGNDFEVYNDYNGLLANLYRCVRDKPDLLINALKSVSYTHLDVYKRQGSGRETDHTISNYMNKESLGDIRTI